MKPRLPAALAALLHLAPASAADGGTARRTFVPVSGRAYILRMSHKPGDCQVGLFRIVPGADPVREKMQRPEPESCLIAPHIASSSSGK